MLRRPPRSTRFHYTALFRCVFGAKDRVGVAAMGVNGRDKSHIDGFGNKPDSDIVAMIDPDSRVLHSRIKAFAKETGNTPASYSDIREALMDKNIDALSIATPNHWHSLAAIWGVQAGRDEIGRASRRDRV